MKAFNFSKKGMMYRFVSLCVLLCVVACEVDDLKVSTDAQDVVSGVVTIIEPPIVLPINLVGALDTGPISIESGSAWLSASVSLHCSSTTPVVVCGREFDPNAPATSTQWCIPITSCMGDATYVVPMSAFTADAHHTLAISVYRANTSASVVNATLSAFVLGDP